MTFVGLTDITTGSIFFESFINDINIVLFLLLYLLNPSSSHFFKSSSLDSLFKSIYMYLRIL